MALRLYVIRALLLCLLLLALPAPEADACPYCKYSPNRWGFCRYYSYAGWDYCEEYVVDEFSGRTGCSGHGYCNWNDPYQAKDGGDGEPTFGCGVTEIDPEQVGIY